MSEIGYRPKGEATPMYHPERDFAYITPTLMRIAVENLDNKNDILREKWRIDNNVNQALVAKAVESIARAQADFVNAVDPPRTFRDALERHGFLNFSFDVQQYVLAAIGEVICGAWFNAVREVSIVGQQSPAAVDMARFSAAVREFCAQHGSPIYDAEYVAEFRAMENRDLRVRFSALESQLSKCREENSALQKQIKTMTAPTAETRSGILPRIFDRLCGLFR